MARHVQRRPEAVEIVARRRHAAGREQPKLHREQDNQDLTGPEHRRRIGQRGQSPRDRVERPVRPGAGEGANRESSAGREQECRQSQQQRGRCMLREHACHWRLVHEGVAKVPDRYGSSITSELFGDRSVEPVLRPHVRVVLGAAPITGERIDGIARREMNQRKGQRRDADHHTGGERHAAHHPAAACAGRSHRASAGLTVSTKAPVQSRKPANAVRYARSPSESTIQK